MSWRQALLHSETLEGVNEGEVLRLSLLTVLLANTPLCCVYLGEDTCFQRENAKKPYISTPSQIPMC